jgi:hypothetical protein
MGFIWSRPDAGWDEMYQRLEAYISKHGHCRKPFHRKEDPHLGDWVTRQRYRKKKGLLKEERIKRLDGIGFQW